MKKIEGILSAEKTRIAIIASRFNSFIVDRLVEGAVDCIVRHGGKEENITLYKVPGAFEIPSLLARIVEKETSKYDAVICLGAVIRGSTPHFEYVSAEVSKGVASVALKSPIPVSFGVLTTDSIEQAVERAGTKAGNKGFEAALSVIEMVNLYREMGE